MSGARLRRAGAWLGLVPLASCEPTKPDPKGVYMVVEAEGISADATEAWVTLESLELTPCPSAQWSPTDALWGRAYAHGSVDAPTRTAHLQAAVSLVGSSRVTVSSFVPNDDIYCGAILTLEPARKDGLAQHTIGYTANGQTTQSTEMWRLASSLVVQIDDDHPETTVTLTLDLRGWADAASGQDGHKLLATAMAAATLHAAPGAPSP